MPSWWETKEPESPDWWLTKQPESPDWWRGQDAIANGPSSLAAPVVSEAFVNGDPNGLLIADAIVTGNPNPDLTYQWHRDGVDIAGATSSSYTTTGSDDGTAITVEVTATNSEGIATAESAAVYPNPSITADDDTTTVDNDTITVDRD